MRIKEVTKENKTGRASLRLYPNQKRFITTNKISVQKVFDKAIEELKKEVKQNENKSNE